MTRWRGHDRPIGVETTEDGSVVVHLAADVITVTPGESGRITVHMDTLEELLEQAGYTRVDEPEEASP